MATTEELIINPNAQPSAFQAFLRAAGSHIIIALITALVTVALALGSYRTKIDVLVAEQSRSQQSFTELSVALNNLRVEVATLSGEMRKRRASDIRDQ